MAIVIGERGIFRSDEKCVKVYKIIPGVKIPLRSYLAKFPFICCEIQCREEP